MAPLHPERVGIPLAVAPAEAKPSFNPQARVCMHCRVRHLALFGAITEAALDRIH